MKPIICKQCGKREVEEARRRWATPICYACLPPARDKVPPKDVG